MKMSPAYQAALDWLYEFVDYSRTHTANLAPENFDLARMHALMAALGNPHQQYLTLHIAGTKGKGSVAALCASALRAAGYRAGLYISPHLQDFSERIQIAGKPIAQSRLVKLVRQIKPHVAAIPRLTTFEITTALAFWYFAQKKVDIAVIEVGLGGRLDATNVITPLVSVITSISLDHTAILGDTLAAIAGEKAGIIKPEVPVVVAPQAEEARQAIVRIAFARRAPLIQVGEDYRFLGLRPSLEGQSLWLWRGEENPKMEAFLEGTSTSKWAPTEVQIPLLGAYQLENAATAYATLQTLRLLGISIGKGSITRGFASTTWPGRFEILRKNPYLVIDSAHNPYSARKFFAALEEYFPGCPVRLVLGFSGDKDTRGFLENLPARLEAVYATASIHPRAMPPAKLAALAAALGHPAQATSSMEEALPAALAGAGPDTVVAVTGSLFVAAAARQVWFDLLA